MSGGEALGRVRVAAPQNVGDELPIPLDPDDGGVQVHMVGGVPVPVFSDPTVKIYETAAAAEIFSVIPAAAIPATLSSIVAHLIGTAAAPRWIQIHEGQLLPALGAKPLLVGATLTPIGGNTQWTPPDQVDRDPVFSNGYVVVLSTTQDTFTNAAAAELTVTAYGRL